MPINGNLSVSTFQSMDGSNFTTAGFDFKFKHGTGAYVGLGTDFEGDKFAVIDFKESNKYSKDGILGHNVRIRTKYNDNFRSTQLRVTPCTVNIPLNNGKTTLYAVPYYGGTYNYHEKSYKSDFGIFAGATQKICDGVSFSLEAQRYNLQNINNSNGGDWSINGILSVKLP